MRKLSAIKLNPKNPRTIKDEKFAQLVASLRSFPDMLMKRPLVCVTDSDKGVYPLGGNMRLRGIREIMASPLPSDHPSWSALRKQKSIPDEWVTLADEWNDDQRREFIVKDNVQFGENEMPMLQQLYSAEELTEWGVLETKEEDEDEDTDQRPKAKKLPALKITFKTTKQLQTAEIEIREALAQRYKGATYSISAGEI